MHLSYFCPPLRPFAGPFFCLILATSASANTIIFTAETTTGVESVTPVLTWETEPLADNCEASGDWSGLKGGAGTETLPPISFGATYNLTCTWTDDSVTLNFIPATLNTNGTPYTDPDGYWIYYGQDSGGPYPLSERVPDPDTTTYVIQPLTSGIWYFVAASINQNAVESAFSGEYQELVGESVEDQKSVGIAVNPRPNPPGLSGGE